MNLETELSNILHGEVALDETTLEHYSRDASAFEVRPQAVVFPRYERDLKKLISFVQKNKHRDPSLSLTARSGGTDMSGGALGESIILDFSKHFNRIWSIEKYEKNIDGVDGEVTAQPGVFYRDLERETLTKNLIVPSYPASREICTIGGMVMNNAGGEKTLTYGKTERYVKRMKMILGDGREYEFSKLTKDELGQKLVENSPEGVLYRNLYTLIASNWGVIKAARPNVSKNSAGYYLWNVWNPDDGSFDLTQLFTGSQGTLGLLTEVTLGLVCPAPHSRLLVIFLRDLSQLAEVIHRVLAYHPESFESYDNKTLALVFRYFPGFIRQMGAANIVRLLFSFAPEIKMTLRGRGLPRLVLLAEFTGKSQTEAAKKAKEASRALAELSGLETHHSGSADETRKYWTIRREAFNLLRHHLKKEKSIPFIDDLIVPSERLREFLSELYLLLDGYRHDMHYAIGGHSGNGNLHIYSILNLRNPRARSLIPELTRKAYELTLRLGGSITAEHNDGLIRSPFLKDMYGPEVYALFEQVKQICDPNNLFNPGKKVGGDWDYALEHIKRE